MRKFVLPFLFGACLMLPSLPAQAGQAQGQTPSAAAPAPSQKSPSTVRSDAAEARYRAWVEQEHAQDASEFTKEKTKIEDKYKGYVRPKHEKKDAKAAKAAAAPAKE